MDYVADIWPNLPPFTQTVIIGVSIYLAIKGVTVNIRRKDE